MRSKKGDIRYWWAFLDSHWHIVKIAKIHKLPNNRVAGVYMATSMCEFRATIFGENDLMIGLSENEIHKKKRKMCIECRKMARESYRKIVERKSATERRYLQHDARISHQQIESTD